MKRALTVLCMVFCIIALAAATFAQSAAELRAPAAFMSYINGPKASLPAPEPEDGFLAAINSSPDGYSNDFPTNKAALGAINATTSWTDVPVEIAETSAREDIFNGLTLGFARGVAQGFTRGMAGIADIVTFPIPPYEKALMEPEYKVEAPQKEFKVAIFRW